MFSSYSDNFKHSTYSCVAESTSVACKKIASILHDATQPSMEALGHVYCLLAGGVKVSAAGCSPVRLFVGYCYLVARQRLRAQFQEMARSSLVSITSIVSPIKSTTYRRRKRIMNTYSYIIPGGRSRESCLHVYRIRLYVSYFTNILRFIILYFNSIFACCPRPSLKIAYITVRIFNNREKKQEK